MTEQVIEAMRLHSEDFDRMCQERWDMGAEQYGPFKFLGNDVIEMTIEELVDMSNYARMQVIKLRMLQEMLEASGILDQVGAGGGVDADGNEFRSTPSFRPAKDTWKGPQ